LLAGGLWVVFTLGDSLRAPDDLSGKWTVHWDQPPAGFPAKGQMHIDQSGRFFTVRFEDGPMLKLKLADKFSGAREGRYLSMTLAGNDVTLSCTGSIGGTEPRRAEDLRLELRGSDGAHTGYAARDVEPLAASATPIQANPAPAPPPPSKTADAR